MAHLCPPLRRRCALWTTRRRLACAQWRTEWVQRCDLWRTQQHQRCDLWRTQQQQRCDLWRTTTEQRCSQWEQESTQKCDSWGIFSFVCLLWVTVTTWVCRGWSWVTTTWCEIWTWITTTVCDLWVTVTSVVCDVWTWVGSTFCDLWTVVVDVFCRLYEWVVEGVCVVLCFFSRLTPNEVFDFKTECIYAWTARYRAVLDATECVLRITLRLRLVPQTGVTGADIIALQGRAEPAIEQEWTSRFQLLLTQGDCRCKAIGVAVDVQWVTSNEHHAVNVQAGSGREDMLNWFATTTGDTAAHEAGHMFGNPDEYRDSNCPNRVVTTDNSIMQTTSGDPRERHYEGWAAWASRKSCCRYAVRAGG